MDAKPLVASVDKPDESKSHPYGTDDDGRGMILGLGVESGETTSGTVRGVVLFERHHPAFQSSLARESTVR